MTEGSTVTPRSLVDAAVAGDRDAFRQLVEPHLPVALGAAAILLRSRSDADDAVQDALLSAWQGLHRLRDPAAFPAWFRQHVVRSAMRRARRIARVLELDVDVAAPLGELERTVERRLLERAFVLLEPQDRLLLTLRHYWAMPVAEVAELLGVPEGTVRSRTHQAMDRLRAAYAAEERR